MAKIAVVFVHGFTGGEETWVNSSGQSFSALLQSDVELESTCDFFQFDYYTQISDIFDSAIIQKIVGRIPFAAEIFGLSGKVKRNRPIKKLAEELSTFLALEAADFDQVILIGHSMGGLICKEHILSYEPGHGPKPIGYVSVAVPHKGALSAQLFGPINVNSAELTPLSAYNDDLNERWVDLKDKLLPSAYLVAQYDEVVSAISSVPYSVAQKQKYVVPHDHTSICKPETTKDPSYKAVRMALTDMAYKSKMVQLANSTPTGWTPAYSKEIFVLKMLVCDIGDKGIEDAKSCFFNAEIMSKSVNRYDREELKGLQAKVLSIYRQKYNEGTSLGMSPNAIFALVHGEIMGQDEKALKSAVEYFNFLHKKGLLHQLANELNQDVVWTDDTDLDKITSEMM